MRHGQHPVQQELKGQIDQHQRHLHRQPNKAQMMPTCKLDTPFLGALRIEKKELKSVHRRHQRVLIQLVKI